MSLPQRAIAIISGLFFLQLSLLGGAAPCAMHRGHDATAGSSVHSMTGHQTTASCDVAGHESQRGPSSPQTPTSCASMAGCAPTSVALLAERREPSAVAVADDLPEPLSVESALATAPELPPPRA